MTAYEKAIQGIEKERNRIEKLRPALEILEDIRDELYPDEDPKHGVCRVEYRTRAARLHLLTGNLSEAVPILRRIRSAGYTLNRWYDVEDNGWRVYSMGDIEVVADLRQRGGSCRREVVGKKEVPVYKIVCDDGSDEVPTDLHSFDAEEVPA